MSILDYKESVINPLKELFLQDTFHQIPDIVMKPNTDIHLITSNVLSAGIVKDGTDSHKKQVSANFDSISEYFEDDNNIIRTQSIDQISKALGATLENSHRTIINDVAEVVTDLRDKIEAQFVKLLKQEKADELLDFKVADINDSDYTFLKWDKLRTKLRQDEIIEAACEQAGLKIASLSQLNATIITNKLKFSEGYSEIDLPKEVTATITEKLSNTFVTTTHGITQQRVDNFLAIITKPARYSGFCAASTSMINKPGDLAQNTLFLLTRSNDFRTIMNKAKVLISDLVHPETLSQIAANMDLLSKSIYAIQYHCLIVKEIRFKDKLILSKEIVNDEYYQEFIKQGHTIQDIHNYLKALFLKSNLPETGVSLGLVKDTDVSVRLAKAAASMKANETFIKSKCLLQAYDLVMNDFGKLIVAEEMYDYGDNPNSVQRFYSIAKGKTGSFAGNLAKVEDSLYDVILSSFYHNTLVYTVYKHFDKAYYNLASMESINDDDVLLAEAGALVDMLSDYLVARLCESKNPIQ